MSTGTCDSCGARIVKPGAGRPAKTCDSCRVGNFYGGEHQRLREWWSEQVDEGGVQCHAVVCLMPSREIMPGAEWDLGHTPDGARWTGPEHARCNRSEGARRGAMAGARRSLPLAEPAGVERRDPGPARPGVQHRSGCQCKTKAARDGVWPSRCW